MSEVNWRIGQMDHLESPWGNAGGVIKTVEELEKMLQTGVGWAEAGSYCLEKRYGNQKDPEGNFKIDPGTGEPVVVYHHDPETEETTNSLGMPGQGMDQLEQEIPEMQRMADAREKGLMFNLAPVTDDPVAETQELVDRTLSAGARRIILNFGCPNVLGQDGESHEPLSYHPVVVSNVLLGLKPILQRFGNQRIAVRTSPFKNYDQAKTVYRRIEASGVVDAVFTPNTWALTKGESSPLGVKGGGRSGPKWADEAAKQTWWAVDTLNDTGIDVVSSSSIKNAQELKRRLAIGAVAGAGTTFYYEAQEAWEEATYKLLRDLAA